MYRDNTLMPKETVRLAALGLLKERGATPYAELAGLIRGFVGRIMGPSLDVMGGSLELLRLEGLIEAVDGTGMADNAPLTITSAGEAEFATFMAAGIRSPAADAMNKLVIALKMRFLPLIDPNDRADQIETIKLLFETELHRLADLQKESPADSPLSHWLAVEIGHAREWIDWCEEHAPACHPRQAPNTAAEAP